MTLSSSSRPTNPRLALFVIAVVFAIMNADITTVNVALVSLGKDLHADLSDLQWGLNSYMLAFAALISSDGAVVCSQARPCFRWLHFFAASRRQFRCW